MKKLAYTFLFFIVFAACFYIGAITIFGRYAPKYLKPNLNYKVGSYGHLNTRIKECQQLDSVDILFLGSSHTYRGFDNRIFESVGLHTFNFGSSAQTPIQTLVLLKRYLEKLHPKLILFEINPFTLSSDGVESSTDIISNDKIDMYTFEMALKVNHIKTYNTLLFALHREILQLNKSYQEPKQRGEDTYIKGGFVESKLKYFTTIPKLPTKDIQLESKQLKAFESCISEIKKRNIKLILVYAPITKNLYSSYTNKSVFDSIMQAHATYLNFNEIMQLNDTFDFYDDHHLNQNGVQKFNHKLIDVLKLNTIE